MVWGGMKGVSEAGNGVLPVRSEAISTAPGIVPS